jgi:hypothetical protein
MISPVSKSPNSCSGRYVEVWFFIVCPLNLTRVKLEVFHVAFFIKPFLQIWFFMAKFMVVIQVIRYVHVASEPIRIYPFFCSASSCATAALSPA